MTRQYKSSLLDRTKSQLGRFDLKAKKGLGQHFLIDEEVLQTILSAAALSPADTVIEVGPGLGVLTKELAKRAGRVIAVELDDRLAAILKETLGKFPNVTIVNKDILDVDPEALLKEQSPATKAYKVVANLPYYITALVLRHFLEASLKPETMVVMVQKEVAEAIAAGSGQRSLLSIAVQFYGKPQIVGKVPAASFYPPPEVDSAILKIDLFPEPAVKVSSTEGFFELVHACFTNPRKQLANSLARGLKLSKSEAVALLERAGISPQRRAGTLDLEEWAQLFRSFSETRC